MTGLTVHTPEATRAIPQETLTTLRSKIRGAAALPGEDGYDAARTIWNAMIDRRPARCRAVPGRRRCHARGRFRARRESPRRGARGGHNIAGSAVCDDGLMIDLSPMTSVRVDPDRATGSGRTGRDPRRFRQGNAGVRAGDSARHQLHHRHRRTDARRRLRLDDAQVRADHRQSISADVVTADGRLIRASEAERPGSILGIARWRRQLRRRHRLRVQAPPARPRRAGGPRRASHRQGAERCCGVTAGSSPKRPTS